MGCVYEIKNITNNKVYIGSTKDYETRKRQHLAKLNNNTHTNIKLQRAWNKYGASSFLFSVIKECEDYKEQEEVLLGSLDFKNNYNICHDARGGYMLLNHPNGEAIRKEMGYAISDYMQSLDEDIRKQKYGRTGENHHGFKGGITKACPECGRSMYYKSKSCRWCYVDNNTGNRKGTKQSKETVARQTEKIKELYKNGFNPVGITVEIDGVQYRSCLQAAKALGIADNTVQRRCRSDKYPNYRLIKRK